MIKVHDHLLFFGPLPNLKTAELINQEIHYIKIPPAEGETKIITELIAVSNAMKQYGLIYTI